MVAKQLPVLRERWGSLSYSQKPANGPYPENGGQ